MKATLIEHSHDIIGDVYLELINSLTLATVSCAKGCAML